MSAPPRYAAFISYNHRDRAHARWLHHALESYRVPAKLCADLGLPARLGPVFLDRAELASSDDLSRSVQEALLRADRLIVVASPHAAASRWVNEEVAHFRELRGRQNILVLTVAGDPACRDGPDSPYPPALFRPGEPEPLAADLRDHGRRDARLKLIAGLLGVAFDALRRREAQRRQRRTAVLAGVMAALAAMFALLAVQATLARREAERQRATAERTADFLKSLFRVSNPDEARGREITARELLDRGAAQIDAELHDQPRLRADMTMTLAETYASLGLYRSARALARRAESVPDGNTRARAAVVEGEVTFEEGAFAAALAHFETALSANPPAALRARALIGRGDALSALERFADAQRDFAAARAVSAATVPPDHAAMTLALESLAANSYFAGDLPTAARRYRAAIAEREAQGGLTHPGVADSLNTLGAIAADQGRRAEAARYYERALPLQRRILGPQHPGYALALNNLARNYLERRLPARAVPMLETSRAIVLAQAGADNDQLAFIKANLGLALDGVGRPAEARAMMLRALRVATLHKHRMRGPILLDLARLDCREGARAAGLARVEAARPLLRADYPGVAWRAALADAVAALCRDEAVPPAVAAAITKQWPPGTLYAVDNL